MISIIVPVYNVENYLERCIESILSQTYRVFELILVDDGSTDNCGVICDAYAQRDSRVIVIHKENGGLSSARNAGLDIAKGDYVGFVDSDDMIGPHYYEALLYFLKVDNSDFVTYSKNAILDTDNWSSLGNDRIVVDSNSVLNEFAEKYYALLGDVVMTKLYKKHIFDNLRFIDGIIYEDTAILPFCVAKSKTITILDFSFYYYTLSEGSIMRSGFSHKRFDILTVWKIYIDFFDQKKMNQQKESFSKLYLYKFVELHRMVHIDYRNLKYSFQPFIIQYNNSINNLRKCNLSKVQRIMMEALPYLPKVSYTLYDKLIR